MQVKRSLIKALKNIKAPQVVLQGAPKATAPHLLFK